MVKIKQLFEEIPVPEEIDIRISKAIKTGNNHKIIKGGLIFFIVVSLVFTSLLFTCYAFPTFSSNLPLIGGLLMHKTNEVIENVQDNYPDNYGGAYIDSNGILNINIVGDDSNIKKDSNVIYHKVKFSLKDLNKAVDKLGKQMQTLGIGALGCDEEKNRVVVWLSNLDDQTIDLIKSNVDNPEMLEFEHKNWESTFN